MWEFITNHIFIITFVAIVSVVVIYIFLKQGSSKKKIALTQDKAKEQSKKEVAKENATEKLAKTSKKEEPQKIVTETIKEENNVSLNCEKPRGERQESLENFKNERLKTHILKLNPTVQAVILKK